MGKLEDIQQIQQTVKERIDNIDEKDFETGSKFGFNLCLEMIKQDTNIDWAKVKKKNPQFNMSRWFHQMWVSARRFK